MWLARWIISCWCTCSMKASVFLHIFGGFFLPAAHEFLMNAETHTRMRRNTKWNADEENGEEECKLLRRVRNIFVHEKPSGGEEEEEATLSLETRDTGRWRSLFRFWSISLSRWQRSFESSLELRRSAAFVIETQGLFSTRNRLGDNFNQLAYIFLQSTHIKKRVNKAVGGGEDEEDNFRKHAALHNSKISSRIHLSFPRHRRANFFWSSSFIFGLWLSRYKYLIKTLFFIITRNDRKINYNSAKFLSAECEREISVLCNVWESSEVRVKCADIAEIRAHGVGKSRTSEKFFASRPGD